MTNSTQSHSSIDRIGKFKLQTPSEYFAEQKAKAAGLIVERFNEHAEQKRKAERCEVLEGALWGLKEAVRTAYLAGHINDVGYPTFRMDEADALLSGQPAPSPKADVNAALVEALEMAQERITELSRFANLPDEGQTQDEIRAALASVNRD